MAANPLTSAGARLERKAFLAYVRRKVRGTSAVDGSGKSEARSLAEVIAWIEGRVARYDKRVGGLGRK